MTVFAADGDTSDARRASTLDGAPTLVIAHRGASGYRPEHTLASYALAIEMGADYHRARSRRDQRRTPHRAPRAAARRYDRRESAAGVRDRASRRGFSTASPSKDFSRATLRSRRSRQLRAVQANPARSKAYDGQFEIPTFEEILDLVAAESTKRNRRIGVYPETKHPAFHLALGLPLEDRLLTTLRRRELDREGAPVFIQSFESANLQYLRSRTKVQLVQLLDDGALRLRRVGHASRERYDPAIRRPARRRSLRSRSRTSPVTQTRSVRGSARSCATSAARRC